MNICGPFCINYDASDRYMEVIQNIDMPPAMFVGYGGINGQGEIVYGILEGMDDPSSGYLCHRVGITSDGTALSDSVSAGYDRVKQEFYCEAGFPNSPFCHPGKTYYFVF